MEHRVVVCAVDLVVRRAVIARHVGHRTLAPEALARIALPKDDRGGLDASGTGAASRWLRLGCPSTSPGTRADLGIITRFPACANV